MKRFLIPFTVALAFAFSFLSSCKEPVTPDTPEEPGTPTDTTTTPQDTTTVPDTTEYVQVIPDTDIKAYFSSSLGGDDELFKEDEPISTGNVAEVRERVWKLWTEANNDLAEEKLIGPDNLDSPSAHSWDLPAELEPDAVMPYYFGTKGSEPAEGYPLFVYMHGSGDKNGEWDMGLQLCQGFDDAPSAYFIPQIPNEGDYYRWWQKAKQYAWEKLLRLAFISEDIDPNRIYFFGISEGGYGSQRLASFYADYLAGAGPMAGGEPLKNAPAENCANTAFSLRTGEIDTGFYRNTLTGYTKDAFDALEAAHPGYYVHHIRLEAGMAHQIDYSQTTPWLKQYERNPYPKYVAWENYEMDGLYRDGFHNIAVLERSNSDYTSRTFYEMEIEGNNINMDVNTLTYTTIETSPMYDIEMRFNRAYTPAQSGKFILYLCPELINLDEEITLTVNGKTVFQGMAEQNTKHIINSCATFFDPERLYTAAIEVELDKL